MVLKRKFGSSATVFMPVQFHNISYRRAGLYITLLSAEILIVEHLCNLYLLPTYGFTLVPTHPKFKGVSTFLVRVMVKIKNTKYQPGMVKLIGVFFDGNSSLLNDHAHAPPLITGINYFMYSIF